VSDRKHIGFMPIVMSLEDIFGYISSKARQIWKKPYLTEGWGMGKE